MAEATKLVKLQLLNLCNKPPGQLLEEDPDVDPYYDSDKDPEYVPEANDAESDGSFEANEIALTEDNQTAETAKGKKRGRSENWEKNIRKKKRNKGEQYTSVTGKVRPEKVFKNFECFCPLRCWENVSEENRKKCFELFYSSGSWQTQTVYISGHVKSQHVNRRYGKGSPSKSRRQFTRYYYLDDNETMKRVCKSMFLNTLCIDSSRVHRALLKAKSGDINDKRGKHVPWNKLDEASLHIVREHIKSFPCYKSHYCRRETERDYLSPSLNLSKMYELYEHFCKEQAIEPVCKSVYNNIFNEFNLSFKPPSKDTCKTCDLLSTQKKAEQSKPQSNRNIDFLAEVTKNHEIHLLASETARAKLSQDKKIPFNDNTKMTITFDLQRTLPTPKLTTGIAYYKRQLWVYNLCIHTYHMCQEKSNMYMWHEAIASRGAQEVASCLKHFVCNKEFHEGIKHLTAWSDSCGGQNRNIKVCTMWMHLLAVTNLETIYHRFLESGHSYLPCDSDFGDIERSSKYHHIVYTPQEWYDLVKGARQKNPFNVVQMKITDFFSTSSLESAIVNRKKDENGQKVEWMKMKEIHFKKIYPPCYVLQVQSFRHTL